jgi:peptidoglycan hydrolase CwlO-like protein
MDDPEIHTNSVKIPMKGSNIFNRVFFQQMGNPLEQQISKSIALEKIKEHEATAREDQKALADELIKKTQKELAMNSQRSIATASRKDARSTPSSHVTPSTTSGNAAPSTISSSGNGGSKLGSLRSEFGW